MAWEPMGDWTVPNVGKSSSDDSLGCRKPRENVTPTSQEKARLSIKSQLFLYPSENCDHKGTEFQGMKNPSKEREDTDTVSQFVEHGRKSPPWKHIKEIS